MSSTISQTRSSPTAPALAPDVELIGRYEDSGFKEPHFIVRRADGKVVQISELLWMVASSIDGASDAERIAAEVSRRYDRKVSADNVEQLLEKLRPMGIVAMPDGRAAPVRTSDPLLALKFRFPIVPAPAVRALSRIVSPVFKAPVAIVLLLTLAALDVWLFFIHGVAQGLRHSLQRPEMMLLVLGMVIASAAFHELGHASACRVSGAQPGPIGAGLYLAWPAFYTDVTDAYRLGRAGRLRTDLGGIYFNGIFSLGTYAAYFITGQEALLLVIAVQHLEVLHQLLPVVRLDGYYILSDLVGVPDLFARIKPILRSLLPWKKADPKVTALKRWVRVTVAAWVLVVIPVLAFNVFLLVANAPRIFATGWEAAAQRFGHMSASLSEGSELDALTSVLQAIIVVLPLLGLTLSFARMGRRATSKAWSATEDRPLMRAVLISSSIALLAFFVARWVTPPGFTPIRPDERGTLTESLVAVTDRSRLTTWQGSVPDPIATPSPSASPSPPAEITSTSAPDASTGAGTGTTTTVTQSPSPTASTSPTTSPAPSPSPSPASPSPSSGASP